MSGGEVIRAAVPRTADGSEARSLPLARLAPWLVALAAFGAAVSAIGAWPVGVFQDDGIYVVLAKSLATGEGYRYLNLPGAPAATHYPPLYPAFLALLWKLDPAFPQNVTLFKFANAMFLGGAAALFHAFARQRLQLGPLAAALSVGAFTACAPTIYLTVVVLSEPMFLCGLGATLIACDRAVASGRPRDAALAGGAAALLSMVRTLGILVVPATLMVLAWRRQWRAVVAMGMIAGAMSIPWLLWVGAHAGEVPYVLLGKYGSYGSWLMDAVRTDGVIFLRDVAMTNIRLLGEMAWRSTATDGQSLFVRIPAVVVVGGLFILGIREWLRRAPAAALFLLLYLLVVVVWPFAPERFVWGVWPMIGLLYGTAILEIWRAGFGRAPMRSVDGASHRRDVARSGSAMRSWRHHGRAAALGVIVLLAIGYSAHNIDGVRRSWWTQLQAQIANRARPLAEWVVANTDSAAVLATDDDVLIYLYTGRRAVPNGTFTPQEHLAAQSRSFATEALRGILASYPIDFVLASSEYGVYAAKGLVQARPAELRIARTLTAGAVFVPVARRAPPGRATEH